MQSRRVLFFYLTGFCAGLVGASGAAEVGTGIPGVRPAGSFDAIRAQFAEPPSRYAPYVFWFWDAPLDKGQLETIAGKILSQRMNPGYVHARYALCDIMKKEHLDPVPSLPPDQWLSPAWFDAVRGVAGLAQTQGFHIGFCDEYWWPTGRAAGRVLQKHPELQHLELAPRISDVQGGETVELPGSFVTVAARRVGDNEPNLRGDWIWAADPSASQACFRKSFDMADPEKISGAALRITADNRYKAYINGRLIGADDDWKSVETFDLKNDLVAGRNVIAIEVSDDGGAKGLSLGLEIVSASEGRRVVLSGSDWLANTTAQENRTAREFNDGKWPPAAVVAAADGSPWSLRVAFQPATILSESIQVIGRGDAFRWQAPASGNWRIYSFSKHTRGGSVNYLNRKLAAAFIQEAYLPYVQSVPDLLGKTISGVFNDHEGHYGPKIAWSEDLEQAFREKRGESLLQCLPLLIDKDSVGRYATVRVDWFTAVSDLYGGYFETLSNWLLKRNLYFISNLWEENLLWQTFAAGDFMSLQRRVSFPGTDCLQLHGLDVSQFKETQTVSEFEGKRMQTEMMGAGNWNQFTPQNLKTVTDAVIASGVDHIVPHGVFSTRQFRNNPWTPDWLDENPTYPFFHLWADYARRATFINAHGRMVADTLLFNPKETIWAESGGKFFLPGYEMTPFDARELYSAEMKSLADGYRQTMQELTKARIDYLIGDSFYLNRMQVRDGRLVYGNRAFRAVILPPVKIMSSDVADKLLLFCRQGGNILAQGSLPSGSPEAGADDPEMVQRMNQLRRLPRFRQLKEPLRDFLSAGNSGLQPGVRFAQGAFDLRSIHRIIDGRSFVWMANSTAQWQESRVFVQRASGAAQKWDCENGTQRRLKSSCTGEGVTVDLSFAPYEAFWLVFDDGAEDVPEAVLPVSKPKDAILIAGPWRVSVDAGNQPVLEFPSELPERFRSAEGVDVQLKDWKEWGLGKFSGRIDYTTPVDFNASVAAGTDLFLDLGRVAEAAELWINGKWIGERLWPPYRFPIPAGALVSGKNTIRIRVANNAGNAYGMDIAAGLFGPVIIGR